VPSRHDALGSETEESIVPEMVDPLFGSTERLGLSELIIVCATKGIQGVHVERNARSKRSHGEGSEDLHHQHAHQNCCQEDHCKPKSTGYACHLQNSHENGITHVAIAEHSMCQPGRPSPHGLGHLGSPKQHNTTQKDQPSRKMCNY
jgi:hypothetical protein